MTSPVDTVGGPGAPALQVPRLLRAAQLVCADGRLLHGRVFLPVVSELHDRPVGVAEWLEEPGRFFPFLPDGEGQPVLLNKEELLVMTVSASGSAEVEGATGAPLRRRVSLECGTVRLSGEVVIDMPASRRRVLDLLNRPGEFLALRNGELLQLVRKSRIVRVSESGVATP